MAADQMKEFAINKNDAGQRLDRFAAKAAPLLPSSLAQKYIRIKRIKVNSKGAKRDYRLLVGDLVQMYVNDEFFEIPNEENAYLKITDPALDIVYEDENIMLVNKPSGVLCHSDSGYDYGSIISRVQAYLYQKGEWRPRNRNLREERFGEESPRDEQPRDEHLLDERASDEHPREESTREKHPREEHPCEEHPRKEHHREEHPREERSNSSIAFAPALCNRIDRNTSGIVIAAKNAETLRIINEKIRRQEIERYYLAVVHGIPKPPTKRLEGYIFKDSVKNRVYVTESSQPGAKSAVMEYRTVATSDGLSLLECRLITGRTHQIRAQLADIGYPVLGDGKYGLGVLDKPYGETKQALCSHKLTFDFKTDAGVLAYLNGQTFQLPEVAFVKKYF